MFARISTFLQESRTELRKVTWPSREDTINYTLTVIVISAAMAIFLGGLDFVFRFILDKFVLR